MFKFIIYLNLLFISIFKNRDLSYCDFGYKGFIELANKMKENYCLTYLDISNQSSEEVFKLSDEMLKYNNSVVDLKIHFLKAKFPQLEESIKDTLESNYVFKRTKRVMLTLRKIPSCIISTVPRRLLLYLLSFLKSNDFLPIKNDQDYYDDSQNWDSYY